MIYHKRYRRETRCHMIYHKRYRRETRYHMIYYKRLHLSTRKLTISTYVEIKCQLDATEVFIADLIACIQSLHQVGKHFPEQCLNDPNPLFQLAFSHPHHTRHKTEPVNQHPANRTHNPQLHTRPAT